MAVKVINSVPILVSRIVLIETFFSTTKVAPERLEGDDLVPHIWALVVNDIIASKISLPGPNDVSQF